MVVNRVVHVRILIVVAPALVGSVHLTERSFSWEQQTILYDSLGNTRSLSVSSPSGRGPFLSFVVCGLDDSVVAESGGYAITRHAVTRLLAAYHNHVRREFGFPVLPWLRSQVPVARTRTLSVIFSEDPTQSSPPRMVCDSCLLW